ncbi:protein kinase [Oculatella sp. FACHB-28]|uniref:protein kinase domain-containing protein n=1 Tax=Oculatella sp. FACHB-28 TaxID=2692845 RepID=UPI001684262A|nr:protein kinase [Oculatella sp. FACHB-28]
MITLSLLHPLKQIPVQVWTFENESVIRIGRSTDNHVILYSAVVSRHHVELRRVGANWEILNLGTNGTYLDGKRITQVPILDGAVMRLARSGPNIQIRIGTEANKDLPNTMTGDRTISQRTDYAFSDTEITGRSGEPPSEFGDTESSIETPKKTVSSVGMIPVPPHLQISSEPSSDISGTIPKPPNSFGKAIASNALSGLDSMDTSESDCTHQRGGGLFCVDCGQPLQVLQTLGDYQLVKVLGEGEIGITYLVWRNGQNLALKTLNPDWIDNPQAQAALECEAEILRQINHPQIPRLVDFFAIAQCPYLVMEMMIGNTVAQQVMAEGPIQFHQAIDWILEICGLLDYLHAFTPPILHRGIRPTSLIYQSAPFAAGEMALVDFGATKAVVLGQENPAGSTGYSAPEQLDINATPAVDLYALGPMLAFLLTGQNPISFYGDRGEGYRFCAESVPNVPPAIRAVMQKVTNPDPEQRFDSASLFADALRQAAHQQD